MKSRYKFTAILLWDAEASSDFSQALQEAQEKADKIAEIVRSCLNFEFDLRVRADKLREPKIPGRLAEFSPDDVLMTVGDIKREFSVDGMNYTLKMDSRRYKLFKNNRTCVCCGIVGTRMFLERGSDQQTPHFNLYGERDGKLVLMTKDHVKPASLGGGNGLENLQTMCMICNSLKGAHELSIEQLRELRKLFDAGKIKEMEARKVEILSVV